MRAKKQTKILDTPYHRMQLGVEKHILSKHMRIWSISKSLTRSSHRIVHFIKANCALLHRGCLYYINFTGHFYYISWWQSRQETEKSGIWCLCTVCIIKFWKACEDKRFLSKKKKKKNENPALYFTKKFWNRTSWGRAFFWNGSMYVYEYVWLIRIRREIQKYRKRSSRTNFYANRSQIQL